MRAAKVRSLTPLLLALLALPQAARTKSDVTMPCPAPDSCIVAVSSERRATRQVVFYKDIYKQGGKTVTLPEDAPLEFEYIKKTSPQFEAEHGYQSFLIKHVFYGWVGGPAPDGSPLPDTDFVAAGTAVTPEAKPAGNGEPNSVSLLPTPYLQCLAELDFEEEAIGEPSSVAWWFTPPDTGVAAHPVPLGSDRRPLHFCNPVDVGNVEENDLAKSAYALNLALLAGRLGLHAFYAGIGSQLLDGVALDPSAIASDTIVSAAAPDNEFVKLSTSPLLKALLSDSTRGAAPTGATASDDATAFRLLVISNRNDLMLLETRGLDSAWERGFDEENLRLSILWSEITPKGEIAPWLSEPFPSFDDLASVAKEQPDLARNLAKMPVFGRLASFLSDADLSDIDQIIVFKDSWVMQSAGIEAFVQALADLPPQTGFDVYSTRTATLHKGYVEAALAETSKGRYFEAEVLAEDELHLATELVGKALGRSLQPSLATVEERPSGSGDPNAFDPTEDGYFLAVADVYGAIGSVILQQDAERLARFLASLGCATGLGGDAGTAVDANSLDTLIQSILGSRDVDPDQALWRLVFDRFGGFHIPERGEPWSRTLTKIVHYGGPDTHAQFFKRISKQLRRYDDDGDLEPICTGLRFIPNSAVDWRPR